MTPAERDALIDRYEAGPALLRSAVAAVPGEALRWRPGPDEFSVHEIVCHCADSETNAAARIRYLVAEQEPLILGYEPMHWARVQDYHAHPLEPALAVIEAVRANTVPLLRRLPEAAWAKEATHTESGRYRGEDWLRIYAAHLEEHVEQIGRTSQAWKFVQERGASGASGSA